MTSDYKEPDCFPDATGGHRQVFLSSGGNQTDHTVGSYEVSSTPTSQMTQQGMMHAHTTGLLVSVNIPCNAQCNHRLLVNSAADGILCSNSKTQVWCNRVQEPTNIRLPELLQVRRHPRMVKRIVLPTVSLLSCLINDFVPN